MQFRIQLALQPAPAVVHRARVIIAALRQPQQAFFQPAGMAGFRQQRPCIAMIEITLRFFNSLSHHVAGGQPFSMKL
jgi:hypothetical protein